MNSFQSFVFTSGLLAFVFHFISCDTYHQSCMFESTKSQGLIQTGKNLQKSCNKVIYRLTGNSNIAYVSIDITASDHKSSICTHALDFIQVPNDILHCSIEKFCKILYNNKTNISHISRRITLLSKKKCNQTWTPVEKWPPEIEVTTKLGHFFKVEIKYEFLSVKNISSRAFNGGSSIIVEEKNEVKEDQPQPMTAIAISVGVVAALAFIVGILWYKRIYDQRERTINEITPYAVHVSLRRRSENAASVFDVAPIENQYDAPTSDNQESEYLRPMKESPYYEIDIDADGNVTNHDCDVYNGAESIDFSQNHRTLRTFQANCPLFSSSADIYSNSDAIAANEMPTCSRSLDNLTSTENNFANVSYGEIIGTMSHEGALERFEPCLVTYKSVRKNR